MLSVHQINKMYGVSPVLNAVSFTIQSGERAGLVGANGCGKTTLLRILAGEETADSGRFQYTPAQLRVGYLPQGLRFAEGETISGFLEKYQGETERLLQHLEALSLRLSQNPDQPDLQAAYDKVLADIAIGGTAGKKAPRILAALGLEEFPPQTPVAHLSGGQRTRLALAGVLIGSPHLLLLDEPTNHLDLEMLEWLEDWLNAFDGGVLVVSHDRAFLDRMATSILELDSATHRITQYAGDYSAYLEQKAAAEQKQIQAFIDQQNEIAQLRAAAGHLRGIARFRKGGKADSGDKFAKGFFHNRARATIGKAKQIEDRIEHILTEEKIDKPRASWSMHMQMTNTQEGSRDVLVCDDLSIGYDGIPLLSNLDLALKFRARCVLVGPNGTGKTTFVRTIAGLLEPVAGRLRIGASVRLGYLSQSQDNLPPGDNALQVILGVTAFNETEARSFLHKYLFSGDAVFTSLTSLSYGERARLSLAVLVAQGSNFLLLDEPINHLDIPSRSRFEEALSSFVGTVLAVVHDRYFIQSFASEIWQVKGKTIRVSG